MPPQTFIPHPLPLPPPPLKTPPPLCTALPPKRIGQLANDLQTAFQTALQARHSRLSLQLPLGAKLGTEIRPREESITQKQKAGDRELARLVAALFEGTGLVVSVMFGVKEDAEMARRLWGGRIECEVGCVGGGGRRGFGGGGRGGEAVDVYVVVGGVGVLGEAVALAKRWGRDKLVVVVNANSDGLVLSEAVRTVWEEFVHVYYYHPDPHPRWKGGVLFRKFPHDWVLCRLSPIGLLQKLLQSEERPSLDRIGQVLQSEQEKSKNSLLNKFSTFIDRNMS